MKHITFTLDFVSPYAWLAFAHLPRALEGLSYRVDYRPVVLGALLRNHGLRGPAEVAPKRDWTYRHVLWLSQHHDIALDLPAVHPFNALPLLRLALACGHGDGLANRWICETVFRHVWQGGGDPVDPARLAALVQTLRPARELGDESVRAELRAGTEAAIHRGLFGVPALEVDGELFWGLDSLPMLRAYLESGVGPDPGQDGMAQEG